MHEDTLELNVLKLLEVIENPEFKHEDMISDFSYMIDEPTKHEPQQIDEGVDTENLDNSENVKETDESHGWLKDHLQSVTPDKVPGGATNGGDNGALAMDFNDSSAKKNSSG